MKLIYNLVDLSSGKVVRKQVFTETPPQLSPNKGYEWRLQEQAPAPTPEQLLAALTFAIKTHLNTKALEYRYDNYHSAMGYVGSPVHKFNAEGVAFRNWVSQVWAYAEKVESDVRAGLRSIPTAQQLIAELPVLTVNY